MLVVERMNVGFARGGDAGTRFVAHRRTIDVAHSHGRVGGLHVTHRKL
ncbi:hypothetical protein [Plantibacter sp. 2H11-2]